MSGSADVRSLAEPRNPFLEEGVDVAPAAPPPQPSRDDVEATLARIWRATLGPKGRDVTRHILHVPVGLRRLLRFTSEAEAALGVKIPPSALMRLGTIKRLAEAIERGEWPEPSPLALLRDGDGEDVLYVVSAGSGVVLELCDLALLIDFPGRSAASSWSRWRASSKGRPAASGWSACWIRRATRSSGRVPNGSASRSGAPAGGWRRSAACGPARLRCTWPGGASP